MECAKIEDAHAKIVVHQMDDAGLPELITKLDDLVSKWVRYSAVDEDGFVECYTSRKKYRPAELDAGHYITRNCMYLRFDLRNIKPQSRLHNRHKYGLAAKFGRRLEKDNPGVTEILLEESKIIYKWSRSELEQMISEYTQKVKSLKI